MLKNKNNMHRRIMHIKTKDVKIVNRFNHDLMSTLWTAVIECEVVLIKRSAVERRGKTHAALWVSKLAKSEAIWCLTCHVSETHGENPLGFPISHCSELNNILLFSLRALDQVDNHYKDSTCGSSLLPNL